MKAIGWAIRGVVIAAAAVGASAQFPVPDAVTGNGTATIKKTPNLMRMQVQLSADGKNLKERCRSCRSARMRPGRSSRRPGPPRGRSPSTT